MSDWRWRPGEESPRIAGPYLVCPTEPDRDQRADGLADITVCWWDGERWVEVESVYGWHQTSPVPSDFLY